MHQKKTRRDFLWGVGSENCSKIRWISWQKIIKPKDHGGLRVGSLKALNIGLMLKWWWRLKAEPNLLWSQVITGIDGLNRKPTHSMSNKALSRVWNNAVRTGDDIGKYIINVNDVIKKNVGSGNDTFFSWMIGRGKTFLKSLVYIRLKRRRIVRYVTESTHQVYLGSERILNLLTNYPISWLK